jgi:hypothetical protein
VAWTKAQIVEQAFDGLALAGYEFDITPEEKALALRRMDAMVAQWESRGIRLGYLLPSSPELSDLNSDSGLPDVAIEAVELNLQVRLAASKGKNLPPQTLALAKAAYDDLLTCAAFPQEQQFKNGLPVGAGNSPHYGYRGIFFPEPSSDPLAIAQGGDLIFPG